MGGNYGFRFSDMLPHSWINKLTKRPPTHKPPQSSLSQANNHLSDQRKSYHFTRDLSSTPPRKSCRRQRKRRRLPKSVDRSTSPEYSSDRVPCKCAQNDVVIEMDDGKPLRPIITKKESAYASLRVKVVKEDLTPRRLSSSSPGGVKLRTNSPRILNRRRRSTSSSSSGRSVTESLAVVKSSRDPRRDFRESMVEMIVEYDLRRSKDLEELLACYLSLNSDEYHDIIINVFKQIWFDFIVHLRIN